MKSIVTILFFSFSFSSICQKFDNNWQVCLSPDHEPPIQYHFLNFDSDPPGLVEYISPLFYSRANLVMSNPEGSLIFYSNGEQIADASHSIMENGDSLNPSIFENTLGDPQIFTLSSVPDLNHEGIYYIIQCSYDTSSLFGFAFNNIYYTIVDMNLNSGLGAVVSKNNLQLNGNFLAYPAIVKHGNGRDWWVITPEFYESKYYIQLLGPEGFSSPNIQEIGYKPADPPDNIGNKFFTPDGSKYIDYDTRNGIRLFDFDRCTGLLSNPKNCDVGILGAGAATISSNSRFLYTTHGAYICQYDLEAEDICASIDTVLFDTANFLDPDSYLLGTWLIQSPLLGPDGKIYIQSTNLNHSLHVIHQPNLKGDLCQVELNAIDIPCENLNDIPLFPNYRLYDIPGSPCDTLGINDPNVATLDVPEKRISVFPNPASEMIYADVSGLQANELHYTLSDITGRVIRTAAVSVFQEKISISCVGLADGVYFLSLFAANKTVLTEKVVIMNEK